MDRQSIREDIRDATNVIKVDNNISICKNKIDLSALIEEANFEILWDLNYMIRFLHQEVRRDK
jgi:hypothetical protein